MELEHRGWPCGWSTLGFGSIIGVDERGVYLGGNGGESEMVGREGTAKLGGTEECVRATTPVSCGELLTSSISSDLGNSFLTLDIERLTAEVLLVAPNQKLNLSSGFPQPGLRCLGSGSLQR